MGKSIVIAERDNIAAIMENNRAVEFFVNRGAVLLGDVYLGKIENVLPSIEATFVDVGFDKMGFLHAEEIPGKGSLKERIKPNDTILVQVVKEPTGHKGPRLTTQISLPGRFLVLIPNEKGVNISKKIGSNTERARLKAILNVIKPVGVGVIVRTEAEGQTEKDIQEDLEILLEKYNSIITASEEHKAPSLLHRDQDLLYKVMREACTDKIDEIVVDSAFALHRTQQLIANWNMDTSIKLSLHKGNEPLLVSSGVMKEIKAALNTKVNLPSGGYLYIQPTEALTVIDVNSGKFVSSASQDETILKTNKEAVKEIARQLRLRNIGGMIIVDFIDMTSRADKIALMEEFELTIEDDKSKPQVGQLSDLGLVELTRHRQGQTLDEMFTKKCPHCSGNGIIFDEFEFAQPLNENDIKQKNPKNKFNQNNYRKNNPKFNKKPQNQESETISTEIKPEIQPEKNIELISEPAEKIQAKTEEKIEKIPPQKAKKAVKNTQKTQKNDENLSKIDEKITKNEQNITENKQKNQSKTKIEKNKKEIADEKPKRTRKTPLKSSKSKEEVKNGKEK